MGIQTYKNLDVYLIFLLARILSVVVVQTFFVPDEYYQSLEVAHNLVFGYGHLTWEWHQGIRSYGYTLIFAFFYKILKVFSLDNPLAVIYLPRIAQALLSAYADLCFYRWSGTKKWAVFILCTSWFWFYMCSRTLINTFETCLTTIALSKFPWIGKETGSIRFSHRNNSFWENNEKKSARQRKRVVSEELCMMFLDDSGRFIWIVTILFVIRPTSAVIWLPLCLYHIMISPKTCLRLLITKYIPISFGVLIISTALDSLAHGSLIITPYNFLKVNVFENIGANYGTQPWYWYLSCGIPAVLGIQILPFIMAVLVVLKMRKNHPNELVMLGSIVFSVIILSSLAHKEFRFLLPLLPMMLYVSSRFLSVWSHKASMFSIWLVSGIILTGNVFPAWYIGYSHQRGTLDVMEGLRDVAVKDPENTSFLFLMPCHSTPLYSHIHINVTTRFLTCNPNLNNIQGYVDEADKFYENPNAWLRQHYPPNSTLPSHIICFDNLVPIIGNDILTRYKRIKQYFHCNVPVSSRIGTYVLIHERNDFEIVWTTK